MSRVLDMKIANLKGEIYKRLHEEIIQQSIKYWIEYNYEIAQGRRAETNSSFIWLDEQYET